MDIKINNHSMEVFMRYKDFGKTGEKTSVLGFGCMRLPMHEVDGKWIANYEESTPLLREAYENGVNYFDSAFSYCNETSEVAVGKAFHDIRDKVMLTTKLPMDRVKSKDDYRKYLEISLERMNTDYVDFYHFWGINKGSFDDIILKYDLLDAAMRCKEEGLVKHISFSFHDAPENMKYIIDKGEILETVLCQYNLLDRSNEDSIAYAHEKGLGVVAMGPVGGGRLAAPSELYTKLTGKESMATYELALRFVLGNPNIDITLSGMENLDMLRKNLVVANDPVPMNEDEWKKIGPAMEDIKKFSDLYCTGCGYCQPCPKDIKIPEIFNMYTYHNVYGLTDVAKGQWNEYNKPEKEHGKVNDCIECGACENKCPQKLNIINDLKRVANVFE